MPLYLQKPRDAKNPNYQIRGSYLHVTGVYESARTAELKFAKIALKRKEREIEEAYRKSAELPGKASGLTFAEALCAYLEAGKSARFTKRLLEHFRDTPCADIDQQAIQAAARTLYPDGDPATRNRQCYTPVIAILNFSNVLIRVSRPEGADGKRRLAWLQPDELHRLFDAAYEIDVRLGALCVFMFYTGCRLSEALRLEWKHLMLGENFGFIGKTKNGDPRPVFLPETVVDVLQGLRRGPQEKSGSVFSYNLRTLYKRFHRACKAAGIDLQPRTATHILRHSYGALMRRHAGMDTSGLVATGAWRSRSSAMIYEHTDVTEEARKASLLPGWKPKLRVIPGDKVA